MVKYMLYPNIVDFINLNMSWMKDAIIVVLLSIGEVPKGHIGQKGHENKIDGPNEPGSNMM